MHSLITEPELVPGYLASTLSWLIFQPQANYWLENEHHTFLSPLVGALRGIGLEGLLAKALCALI